MINGKAVIKFGNGSVMVTPVCNNLEDGQVGAVCFNAAEPGEIDRKTPVKSQDFSKQASVIMTFSKPESIDVVIKALTWLKNTMNNETPETDRIGWDKPFNLDILKEEEEMKKESLFPELKRYAKTMLGAPDAKHVVIYTFDTTEQAQKKSNKLKSWPYKVIIKARDERGRFTKGYALICCK